MPATSTTCSRECAVCGISFHGELKVGEPMASSNVIQRSQLFWVAVSTAGAVNGAAAISAEVLSSDVEKNCAVPAAHCR